MGSVFSTKQSSTTVVECDATAQRVFELSIEMKDEDADLWDDTERGLVKSELPEKGQMLVFRVDGRDVLYFSDGRPILLDSSS